MNLHIISPLTTDTYIIAWVDVHTQSGSFVIQPGHAPTILTLRPDSEVIFRLSTGKRENLTVQQGIMEVTRDDVTLLINSLQ